MSKHIYIFTAYSRLTMSSEQNRILKIMKTNFFFLIALFLSLLYVGCEKDKPDDPTPTTTADLQCNVQVDKDTVTEGSNVMFSWTSNADSLILTINENNHQSLNKNGSKVFGIQETSSFVFRFYKNDSTLAKTFNIIAVPPPPPNFNVDFGSYNVNYGDSLPFTVTGNFDSVTMNPPASGFNGGLGTFWTDPILETTTYHFIAYGEGGQSNVDATITRNYFPLPWGAPLIKCERIVTGVFYSYTGEEPWIPLLSWRLGCRYAYYNDLSMKFVDIDGDVGFANWDIIEDGRFLNITMEDPAYHEIVVITDSICKLKYELNDFWVMYAMEPYVE